MSINLNEDQKKNLYETSSLPLAATILSLDISLEAVNQDSEGKSVFVFTRTDHLDKLLKSFWKKSLRVEPNTFWEQIRFLKSRIYGG